MKNKLLVLSMIGIVGIVIIVAIIIALYYTTDLFKTDQELFYKYLSKVEVINSNFSQQYFLANNKIINNNSTTTNIKISKEAKNQETGVSNVEEFLNLKSNSLKNDASKQKYMDFIISDNNQDILNFKYIRDNNTYAVIEEHIVTKYLAVENANLKDLAQKIGITDTSKIPDSININNEYFFEFDEVMLQNLAQSYLALISDNIDATHYEKNTNDNGEEILKLQLSQQDLVNLFKMVLEKAQNDTTLLNLIVKKAQQIQADSITIESIQEEINYIIEEIDSISNYSTEKDFFVVSLIKKDKKIARIVVDIDFNKVLHNMDLEDMNLDSDVKYDKISIGLDISESNKIIITTKENNNLNGMIEIVYSYDSDNINADIKMQNYKEEKNLGISYKLDNYKTDNISQNCTINIDGYFDENILINITNNSVFKQDIQIERLTKDNSVKINDLSSEQIKKLNSALEDKMDELFLNLYSANILGVKSTILNEDKSTGVSPNSLNEDDLFGAAQNALNAYERAYEEEYKKMENESTQNY